MKSGKRLSFTALFLTNFVLSSFVLTASLSAQQGPATETHHSKPVVETGLMLREGWSLQSSAKVEAKGEVISTPAFSPNGWHAVTIPSTVVAVDTRLTSRSTRGRSHHPDQAATTSARPRCEPAPPA